MYILFDYNFFSLLPPVDASYIFPANFGSDEKFILKQIKADQLCDAREIKKKKSRFSILSVLSTGTVKTSLITRYICIYEHVKKNVAPTFRSEIKTYYIKLQSLNPFCNFDLFNVILLFFLRTRLIIIPLPRLALFRRISFSHFSPYPFLPSFPPPPSLPSPRGQIHLLGTFHIQTHR